MRLVTGFANRSETGSLRCWAIGNGRMTIRVSTLASMVFLLGSLCASAQSVEPSEIVWRMVAQNQNRAQQLKYYTSLRRYHVEFHGFGRSMAADMDVQATYTAERGKSFQIVDQSGSRILLDHVLKKLLKTEEEASRQHKTALTPFNYTFVFDREMTENGRRLYVFSVEPKKRNKLLYRGKIWIDAEDYAVVKIDAQPAENPSFWIEKTEIHHVYAKNGEFWLPETNRSDSKVRLGGSAILTIEYGAYKFEEPHGIAQAEAPVLAAPQTLADAR